eukprot:1158508-Pelagomonas_calceolata.AAC.23
MEHAHHAAGIVCLQQACIALFEETEHMHHAAGIVCLQQACIALFEEAGHAHHGRHLCGTLTMVMALHRYQKKGSVEVHAFAAGMHIMARIMALA